MASWDLTENKSRIELSHPCKGSDAHLCEALKPGQSGQRAGLGHGNGSESNHLVCREAVI